MPRAVAMTHVEAQKAEHEEIRQLSRMLAASLTLRLVAEDGSAASVPASVHSAMAAVAAALEGGNRVDVLDGGVAELTPNEAAQLLGVSRPTVLKLIEDGHLAAEHVPGSSHRRLARADVERFAQERDAFQRELASIGDEARASGLFARAGRRRR